MKNIEKECNKCKLVLDSERNKVGIVCVVPSKDLGKRDLIFFDSKERRAKSLRSVTELMNLLASKGIPEEEIVRTTIFVGNQLRDLEREKTVKELKTPFGGGRIEEEID